MSQFVSSSVVGRVVDYVYLTNQTYTNWTQCAYLSRSLYFVRSFSVCVVWGVLIWLIADTALHRGLSANRVLQSRDSIVGQIHIKVNWSGSIDDLFRCCVNALQLWITCVSWPDAISELRTTQCTSLYMLSSVLREASCIGSSVTVDIDCLGKMMQHININRWSWQGIQEQAWTYKLSVYGLGLVQPS